MTLPSLCENGAISKDAAKRVHKYTKGIGMPVGAYAANSKGFVHIRELVAEFIRKRDGCKDMEINVNNIFMTNGASEGVNLCYQLLIRNPDDGIMIPIPQYPLYSA